MTAEIVIVNKNAVALAADSAVTFRDPETPKIYNTANKVFMLSKFHPVGIMVYGSAEFMGVPWEIIIKVYRSKLGSRNFDKLDQFATNFFEHLDQSRLLFSDSRQRSHFRSLLSGFFWNIRSLIQKRVEEALKTSNPLSDSELASLVDQEISDWVESWRVDEDLKCFNSEFNTTASQRYKQEIDETIDFVFEQLVNDEQKEKLRHLAIWRVTKNRWADSSGLVFAGFGEQQIFPCVKSFKVECVLCDKTRLFPTDIWSHDMNEVYSASIIPFAQAEIVHRFLRGIDPEYKADISKYLETLLTAAYPEKLRDTLKHKVSEKDQEELVKELTQAGKAILQDAQREWENREFKRYVEPVVDTVAELPKDELAAMAESLVNLTSFKRRISKDMETVGGPVDVAVISKGDGFIWIKRKHYFSKELNPHFLTTYYRTEARHEE
jgi:hypothetical protein